MTRYITLIITFALLAPTVVHAQGSGIAGLIAYFTGMINGLLGLLTGVALLVFIWGLVKFIYQADNEQGRADGKQRMVWGVIALFVLVSIWGIISFFQLSIFGEEPDTVLDIN